MNSYISRVDIAFLLGTVGVLLLVMFSTNPSRGSLVILLWFVLFGAAVYFCTRVCMKLLGLDDHSLVPALLSGSAMVAIGLSTINQLTFSDVLLICGVAGVSVYLIKLRGNS